MWTLRVEYRRRGQVGEGWVVVGTARDQPTVTWGPFGTPAEADECLGALLAWPGALTSA